MYSTAKEDKYSSSHFSAKYALVPGNLVVIDGYLEDSFSFYRRVPRHEKGSILITNISIILYSILVLPAKFLTPAKFGRSKTILTAF